MYVWYSCEYLAQAEQMGLRFQFSHAGIVRTIFQALSSYSGRTTVPTHDRDNLDVPHRLGDVSHHLSEA